MTTSDDRARLFARLGIALAGAAATVPLVYATLRLVGAATVPEPDPAIVVWSTKPALLWRFLASGYVAGMVGIALFGLSGKRADLAARWCWILTVIGAIAISSQGLLVP